MQIKKIFKKLLLLALVITGNLSFILLLRQAVASWRLTNDRYVTREIYDKPLQQMRKFSHDGNGEDQLIAVLPNVDYPPRTKEILLFSPFKRSYAQVSFLLHLKVPLNHQYFPPLDLDGDRKVEVPFMWIVNRKFHFAARDLTGKVIHSQVLEPLSLPIPSDTTIFSPIDITDIDNDGRFELIWTVSGEFMGLPRGIAVHDLESGRLKWEYLFGGIPFQTKIVDINDDGRKEIIFSAWAPHNGYSHNGMNDDTSYVGVLSADGNLIWRKEAGGYYSQIYFSVADVNGGNRPEIVTARSCHREINPDPGEICILNAENGSLTHRFSKSFTSYTHPVVAEINGSPGPEIIIGDASGSLSIFDSQLRSQKKAFLGERIAVLAVDKFGEKETNLIAARVGSTDFILFDQNLKQLYQYRNPDKINETIEVLALRNAENTHLLLNADRPFLIHGNPSHGTVLSLILHGNFPLILSLGLAFNFLALIHARLKRNRHPSGAIPRTDSGWLTVTQEMVHRMKTPMTNILWDAEQMKTGLENAKDAGALSEAIRKTPDSLIGELKELKLMNRYLMKFLQIESPKFKNIDINALLREETEKYSRHLKGRIRFHLQLENDLPLIAVDEEQIGEVFINLIENAIDAMPDGGELEISSRWQPKNPKGAVIVFRDNGKGIDENQLKLIFTPNFTTKKEGFGIGLPVCQRIVAAHGGTIVVESQKGIGTRIAILIPEGTSAPGKNE